ncbi:YceI family protein [Marinilongibacter aquaticus]|uniref:YceI family protein n=1 Tax=Marinilongibacter aquaticus TaxID=2975157 RepID=UPI0021BD3F8F|nr:YceI family protein [Marinilongibacter aquaticus]UBM60485.1 YceI family protein [Marinilongibacter aquaticus]
MKKIALLFTAALAIGTFYSCTSSSESTETATEESSAGLADGTVNIDLAASTVGWKGVMLGVKEHTGTVGVSEGTLSVKDGVIDGGKFVVDLSTIAPTDTVYDEEHTKEKLVGHLSSPDFFHVEQFPNATFEITGGTPSSVTGNLTIRDKTHEATVENVSVSEENGAKVITGELTFNRKDFDVSFDVPVKDMVISDDVELDIKLVTQQ